MSKLSNSSFNKSLFSTLSAQHMQTWGLWTHRNKYTESVRGMLWISSIYCHINHDIIQWKDHFDSGYLSNYICPSLNNNMSDVCEILLRAAKSFECIYI